MNQKFDFLFPDGYIYAASLNPQSPISEAIAELRYAIFNEDKEQFEDSVQSIKFFYSGIFLNENFKFGEIHYNSEYPLKVYIKPTPEALEAKSQHYNNILSVGFKRNSYTEDDKEDKIVEEENKIRSEISSSEINSLKSITPQNISESIMILFYLESNQDLKQLAKYFAELPNK